MPSPWEANLPWALVKAIDVEWAKLDLDAMRRFYSNTKRPTP